MASFTDDEVQDGNVVDDGTEDIDDRYFIGELEHGMESYVMGLDEGDEDKGDE